MVRVATQAKLGESHTGRTVGRGRQVSHVWCLMQLKHCWMFKILCFGDFFVRKHYFQHQETEYRLKILVNAASLAV